ncbi:biotin-dependent carboxylase-like uncharacterized protein [Antricoccus suffuscus]|uniref:Biotin-dependent carboxylase-like uncharacterized protein n=1 Tax=Antricoccus suffuscus TaxID=1629062 RepID=A0A2T0ZW50_9ACTN|nr:biotin-dependent carboxyltransferase family protein [Antricoccus suffuscus]PRZ40572.1 biotin-dependent carboxylase-like uncharacterized protein [Antricoccus suffuscus]
MIEIVATGLEATVQDVGRSGWAHLGVPRAGAADLAAYDLANRLVGNPADAAAVEFLLGGLAVRFTEPTSFALTGAPVPVTLDGRGVDMATTTYAATGQKLVTGRAIYGLRTYLGVGGGIDVERVLGSRSSDTLSGLGPPRLTDGDTLPIGRHSGTSGTPTDVVVDTASATDEIEVRFIRGPRADFFSDQARELFEAARWTVSSDINRVGARLEGPRLEYAGDVQLPSEGMLVGSVQVPPSGQPIIFLANHPPSGGYPIIGVVIGADVGKVAQAEPGKTVHFRAVS